MVVQLVVVLAGFAASGAFVLHHEARTGAVEASLRAQYEKIGQLERRTNGLPDIRKELKELKKELRTMREQAHRMANKDEDGETADEGKAVQKEANTSLVDQKNQSQTEEDEGEDEDEDEDEDDDEESGGKGKRKGKRNGKGKRSKKSKRKRKHG